MIINSNGMKSIEKESGYSSAQLMLRAGRALTNEIVSRCPKDSKICILAGCGNNGGDGFVIARFLLQKGYHVRVYLTDGLPKTKEAQHNFKRLDPKIFITRKNLKNNLVHSDCIIDAVYGFSYHGALTMETASVFDMVNSLDVPVYAVDINSGCEADSGYCDPHALHAELTMALDCWKPFHLMYKEHQMFNESICIDLELPHPDSSPYLEMNEERFFAQFPKKQMNAYKGTYGHTLLIGGCFGMAGAVVLNITGAKTVGAPYIDAALPEEIYDVAACHHVTPVFHPFGHETILQVLEPLCQQAKAVAFGSGAVHMDRKNDVLDLILQNTKVPVVLDADALRMLKHNTWILRFAQCPLILTPHVGELADILGQPISYVQEHRIECASAFAKENHVTVVLKGADTVAAFANGHLYINQSGNQALAQAGSGDLLTGMMAGMLTMVDDVEQAVCMAVWLHGALADIGIQQHSIQNFPLESYPSIMDALFKKHNF